MLRHLHHPAAATRRTYHKRHIDLIDHIGQTAKLKLCVNSEVLLGDRVSVRNAASNKVLNVHTKSPQAAPTALGDYPRNRS